MLYDGPFWDGVSVHAYQGGPGFSPHDLEEDADTVRAIMREYGHAGGLLWNTEFGWGIDEELTQEQDARNLCQSFSTTAGSWARPEGGFDRMCWWYSYRPPGGMSWGLLDTDLAPQPNFYALKQTAQALTGKRLNGRVMTGDTLTDPLVRMYEFEDPASLKKTWVCWANPPVSPPPSIAVKLPVRNNQVDTVALDYDGSEPTDQKSAASTGWLNAALLPRPVFVTETESACRPDVVVDSLRMVPSRLAIGSPATAHVYFHNAGNATTPLSGPLSNDYTWVVLRHDGDSVAQASYHDSLNPNNSGYVTISVDTVPASWWGSALFDATANYKQRYVEKDGMDDNDGYSRNRVVWPPIGEIGEACGGHSNAPLPLLGFETHSVEADTLGSVPAESARLVQWAYGNDSVVDGGDTTDWFCVNQAVSLDTSWLYLSGQSKYKFFIQVKDSWSMSDLIPDTTHPYVVFDTTGPAGSVVINGGDRFTTSSTCTLTLTANDSASGVAAMRFMNAPKVDLVVEGSFTATAGSWQHENSAVDTLLHMARLSVAPVEARVRQFIPAESISAHAGDSCALEASILAHVHEDDAAGGVSFWLYSIREDSLNFHDTLWELVDSACYSGELLSLTGRYGLSKHFLLEEPAPESGWVWRGGMVKVDANSENGTGSVWTDGVSIVPYQSGSGYSWWNSYDTLVQWDLDSGAGMKVVHALYLDSTGNENATPYADTIVLDPTAPVVDISVPGPGTIVNNTTEITGWTYDPVEVPGDTWLQHRALSYRHVDSANWLPVDPDSVSYEPAYPDSQQILGPAVHLGYWNTDSVPDGEYYVLLTATDSAGQVSSCTTWVVVSNIGGGGDFCGGPEGGGTGMGEGSCYVGSAEGVMLHLSDALDSLDAFSVDDSGSQANITAILEVGEDSILVLDAANKRVHKLHRSGQHRRRLVSNLSQPTDLKKDANGNLYLVDRGLHRIGKFRSNGTLVFTRGGLGADSLHFHAPEGIAVKGGLVYVADGGNNRIAVWDTSGNFKITVTGDFENPTAVWVMESGAIYLTDGSDGKLKGITPLGGSIVAIGTDDSSKLKGLVPSENRHSFFSLAAVPNKVYRLRILSDDSTPGGQQSAGKVILPKTLSLAQPFPNPARTRLNIAYALPRQTRVVLKLYDVAGKLVTTLANGEQKPGYYDLTWNRQDTKGRTCACGVYFCTLAAENQRFSRKVILTE